MRRVDGRIGRQGYALTLEGLVLAATEKPPCRGCGEPVEPGLDDRWTWLCRGCLADMYEQDARRAEQSAEHWRAQAAEYLARAEDLHARAAALADEGAT